MTTIDTSNGRPSLMDAARTQVRVIVAMVLRDVVQEAGGNRVGFIMMLLRPALIVGLFYLVYLGVRKTPQGMPLLAFIVTGWLGWFAFIRTFSYTKAVETAGVLSFPQVTSLDLFITNFVVAWVVYSLVFTFFIVVTLLIERSPLPANPLQVYVAFWSICYMGAVLQLIFSSFARIVPFILGFAVFLRRVGSIITGVAIAGADTPPQILAYLSWNPLFHCLELMREAWWPAYESPIADMPFVAKFLFLATAFGLALERVTRRFIRR